MSMQLEKSCTKCGVPKPLTDFHRDPRNRDGRQGQCKTCRNAVSVRWQQKNRKKTQAACRRWREGHPNMVRAYSKKYWAENKEACKARRAEWMTPELNSYYLRLRRDRKRGAEGHHTLVQLRDRIAFYGGLCWMCGSEADTIDHVIPLAKRGTEWPANLRPACRQCNSRKGVKESLSEHTRQH